MSRYQSAKVGYYKTVVYSHLVTLAFLVALIPFLDPAISFPLVPVAALVVAGLLNFVAFIFLYRAFHTGVVSIVAPVAYTYPAVTTVLSLVILGAVLTSLQVYAIAGIIAGVLLVSTRFSELRKYLGGKGAPNLAAGLTSAIGSSVFFGSVYIGVGYAAPLVVIVLPALVLRIVGTGAGVALSPVLKQDIRPSRLAFSRVLIAMGALEAAGFLSFTYGISGGSDSLPIVAALSGMGGAVATTYAFTLLKERLEWNQVLGVALSLFGVFTLLYFGG